MATLLDPPTNLTDWLQPGDALLYRSSGFYAWAIRVKTWSRCNHIEVYMGKGIAYAARAEGVRSYPLRTEGLWAVLRPIEPFDAASATAWFNANAVGQKYDWMAVFRYFTLGKQSTTQQNCSELATRLYRSGKFQAFAEKVDADLIVPGHYPLSPHFRELWCAEFGD